MQSGGVCKLTKSELDLEKRTAKLHEKGDKVRVFLFVEKTVDAISEWLEVRFLMIVRLSLLYWQRIDR